MTIVTTSWDDGDILDLRLAELLDKYGIKGTFYIAQKYRPHRLSETEIVSLASRHEIGAHTLTHPILADISPQLQTEEITLSKKWLQEVLGFEVPMFCYPSGKFDKEAIKIAREAGFLGARTTELGCLDLGSEPFEIPTTIQVYPIPFRKVDSSSFAWRSLLSPLIERGPKLWRIGVPFYSFHSFTSLTKATFDLAKKRSGVFHLWGHSWEIDRYNMWEDLEAVLAYISKQEDCCYLTNGELVSQYGQK